MLNVEVNDRTIAAKPGETILEVSRRAGFQIPTLCHLEGLSPTGACRICVVEVENAAGLLPACSYPVQDGMKIKTHSAKAVEARRTIVQLLLSNHPDDCLYCSRSGNCDLQQLARDLNVDRRLYRGARSSYPLDVSGAALVRDPGKCILCGKCVRVCEEIQTVAAIDFLHRGSKAVIGTAFDRGLNTSSCVNCGQCVIACPTGALSERSNVQDVLSALADPTKTVVVQHAPAVSVTLAEEFGAKPGRDLDGEMVAALRLMGFARVFDTSFAADLTIMEEASELAHRVATGGTLPMLTSCSPGWIKFVETFYPEFIPNLSTCKSPQQMMGAVIKSFWAERNGLDPRNIVSVSIMPCTAKKFERSRAEMAHDFVPDVDYVLTTREAAQLIRTAGIDILGLQPESADTPFGERSGAGKIFGASGGVMEAAVRTANFLLTGSELSELDIQPLRGLHGAKELRARIGDLEVSAAVVSGLGNARALLDAVKAGQKQLHFIEVMTCPGGCINGGGQPFHTDPMALKARMRALYSIDRSESLRTSHANLSVKRLYDEFLGRPLGERSHHLLHTHYQQRDVLI
ncbi:MAG: iron hydrogenase small subunit [Polyangiaceae bacterium]|nr:iron hydrogenase small subunit [Polyangiaceae bacterium]